MSARDDRRRLERRAARGDAEAKARIEAAEKERAKPSSLLSDLPSGAEEAGRLRATTLVDADDVAADELVMYADNERELYDFQREIAKNMIRRWLKGGGYDPVLAAKGWGYVVDRAAQKYTVEFGSEPAGRRSSFGIFDRKTRELAAWILSTRFEDQARLGEWDDVARELLPKRPRKPHRNSMDSERRRALERLAARGDMVARRRLEEEDRAQSPADPMERIKAVLGRLNARHDLGLGLGYVGNLYHDLDDRSWRIFTRVPTPGGNAASFGGHPTTDLEALANLVESSRFAAWVERLVPRAHLRRRDYRIVARGLPPGRWGSLDHELTALGASLGSRGAGEWTFSISGMTLEQLRAALSQFGALIEVGEAYSPVPMRTPWWPGMHGPDDGPPY